MRRLLLIMYFRINKIGDEMETSKKSKNNFLKLALGALGIVYGDIGTSPLYTLKECFSPAYGTALTQENILP